MFALFSGGLAAAMLALGVNSALAALSASADISTSQSSAPFNYNITLHNTGTTNIGSFWFAWNPTGYDFLPTQPLSVTAPANWSYTVTNLYPGYDGYGLEFVDRGPRSPLAVRLPAFNSRATTRRRTSRALRPGTPSRR